MMLTPEEARHIAKRRRSERRDEFFRKGLLAAASEVMAWDGAIPDPGTRRQLAEAIVNLRRPRRAAKED
jgi:hypothetical protein